MINNIIDINKLIGKNILAILSGLIPKEEITANSYSLDNLETDITKDIKNVTGRVKKIICGIVYRYSQNKSKKSIFIIDVKDTIFTKKTILVIKDSPKNIGKKLIANCECK
jgi:hypothetical protein